ncbi:dihydroorotase [Abditibacterium utsteinense]|uniref:Dihydroorotase n=1 Tax=Abditibacterium utsteinense TaxID=1960156 RepID=A0A2S8STZ8_9BACT|nr:dihydroorotase [Abditibacterium utsteinense]PQV64277.1 dihydroorotase [Abditibacterium utsteinense]
MKIILKNGRLIDPSQKMDGAFDLLIEDGVISQIGENLSCDAAEIFDATGLIVAPGFVDIHVHGRTPGQEYKEDTQTLTAAAAAGGFTSVCVMPNTLPTIDNRSVVEDVLSRAKVEGNGVRIYPIASVSIAAKNEQLSEFSELKNAGAIAVSDDAFPLQDADFMRRIFRYAKTLDLVTMLHCEDISLTGGGHAGVGKGGGVMNEGAVSMELGLRGMPRVSEEIAVYKACALAREVGNHIHILHVSTRAAVDLIREFKARGVRVTSEAGPHHFGLSDEAVRGYNTNAKMNPPLRLQEDADAIVAGFADGTIDCIATDHAPHAAHEKDREFDQAPFGIIGLETAFPVSLDKLVTNGPLSLSQLVEKMTTAPARLLGLDAGTLQVGRRADVCIFAPEEEWILSEETIDSKSKNTPWLGQTMKGRVKATFVDGKQIHFHKK